MSTVRHDAIMAHWEAFKVDPPLSMLVPESKARALAEAVERAVERGRPLSKAEVLAIAGVKDAGPDPDPDNPRDV